MEQQNAINHAYTGVAAQHDQGSVTDRPTLSHTPRDAGLGASSGSHRSLGSPTEPSSAIPSTIAPPSRSHATASSASTSPIVPSHVGTSGYSIPRCNTEPRQTYMYHSGRHYLNAERLGIRRGKILKFPDVQRWGHLQVSRYRDDHKVAESNVLADGGRAGPVFHGEHAGVVLYIHPCSKYAQVAMFNTHQTQGVGGLSNAERKETLNVNP